MTTEGINTTTNQARTSKAKPLALVVDDDRDLRKTMVEILQINGFQVYSVKNGMDAIKIVRHMPDKFNLVFLDMRMPGMTGRETFEKIREINPDQKIIIITGYSEFDDLESVREKADGFVKKPFNLHELVSISRNVVGLKNDR